MNEVFLPVPIDVQMETLLDDVVTERRIRFVVEPRYRFPTAGDGSVVTPVHVILELDDEPVNGSSLNVDLDPQLGSKETDPIRVFDARHSLGQRGGVHSYNGTKWRAKVTRYEYLSDDVGFAILMKLSAEELLEVVNWFASTLLQCEHFSELGEGFGTGRFTPSQPRL